MNNEDLLNPSPSHEALRVVWLPVVILGLGAIMIATMVIYWHLHDAKLSKVYGGGHKTFPSYATKSKH